MSCDVEKGTFLPCLRRFDVCVMLEREDFLWNAGPEHSRGALDHWVLLVADRFSFSLLCFPSFSDVGGLAL